MASRKKNEKYNFHDYGGTDVEQVYSTIHEDLLSLKFAFLAIKNDLVNCTLVTDKCVLRKVKKEDAESMFKKWASDKEITKYLTWNPHENIEATKHIIDKWIEEEKEPKTIRFMITLKSSDEPVGSIDVVKYIDNNPEIGYCLSKAYWNKGIMTESCKAFTKYLFDIGFKKILISAAAENISSIRVIEKCGFKFTFQEKIDHFSPSKPEPIVINHYELTK